MYQLKRLDFTSSMDEMRVLERICRDQQIKIRYDDGKVKNLYNIFFTRSVISTVRVALEFGIIFDNLYDSPTCLAYFAMIYILRNPLPKDHQH